MTCLKSLTLSTMHWCLLSIGGVALIGVVLRFLVRRITFKDGVVAHVDEFIGNLFSGVFIMELGVIASSYGKYSAALLLAGFVHLFLKFTYFTRYRGGYQSPLSFVASYYQNGRSIRFSLFFAASIVVTQFVALYCGQLFAKFIWAFEDRTHVDAMQVACTTALSMTHPWTYCALYEAFGVLIGVSIDFLTPHVLKEFIAALVTMALYFFFTHVSGSFLNPIVATAFSFRCEGHQSDWQYFVVYWVAPAVGMIIAWEFWLGINKFMRKQVPKKTE